MADTNDTAGLRKLAADISVSLNDDERLMLKRSAACLEALEAEKASMELALKLKADEIRDTKAYLRIADDHMKAAEARERKALAQVEALEGLRPHWAQGYSDASVAAQVATEALSQLWEMLGVTNQTKAVEVLRAALHPITKDQADER